MGCRVACLDVWTDAVRAEVRRAAPADFELRFAASYEPAHQRDLAAQAEFVVADHPLLALEQVVATPHVGGGVFDNVAPVARHVFGNIERFRRGEALPAADLILPGVSP